MLLLVLAMLISMPLLIVLGTVVLTKWDRSVQAADATYTENRLSLRRRLIYVAVAAAAMLYAYRGYAGKGIWVPGKFGGVVRFAGLAEQILFAAILCFGFRLLLEVAVCYLPRRCYRLVGRFMRWMEYAVLALLVAAFLARLLYLVWR
ncbi:hypothetical protein [Neisseria canis]|uniref:hypothetical protein n=1 Tax=Neisseria canis TaxID=493 RepID=UPI000F849C70|nr:hypothetical protein [Neisseria canis]